jgi:DNA mismatch repair protein MutS
MTSTPIKKQSDLPTKTDATPMMQQFIGIKEEHKDYLLFYRMGDFYEMFFDDAIIAAEALDIALTKRGKHQEKDIPMCGVPVHSHEAYLQRLIKKGFKVAVCEQVEAPEEAKKRGAKSVVKREVVRIITPGTLTEDTLLEARAANYLVALNRFKGTFALAWMDISTGEFQVSSVPQENIPAELARLNPKEILVPDNVLEDNAFYAQLADWRAQLTPYVVSFFDPTKAERKIKEVFEVASLDAFGQFSPEEAGACGALLEYASLTQKEQMPKLSPPKQFVAHAFMLIDPATRKNLELTRTQNGDYKGSLLNIIDKTSTAAGARMLISRLSTPLVSTDTIAARQDEVEYFIQNQEMREELRKALKELSDIERALSRLSAGRGGPRDLVSLRQALLRSDQIAYTLENASEANMPEGVKNIKQGLGSYDLLLSTLQKALEDEVPFHMRDGGFVREGFDPALDKARNAREEGENQKEALREKYVEETGIERLRVKNNNLIGFYIEVSVKDSPRVPEGFVHRQTMKDAVRYSTPELRAIENDIINSEGTALNLEADIFSKLVWQVVENAESLRRTAYCLACLDVAAGLAYLAVKHNYSRPKVDNSLEFNIEKGRHAVVEKSLSSSGDEFIHNDCALSEENRLWLLTGPNMAGKSTFLRQNALIVILAQMGSFVPAEKATIGVVDRLFSRVGASDDLARGRSTFMVEMVETATILNQSTERSFVILDEIGRGTSTFDGLSIAWAVMEYLHDVLSCRTLFATHYHELTALTQKLALLSSHTMKVKEWEGDVIFLHEVIEGNADRSYGIHVGKLAGLPKPVLKRAEQILHMLEQGKENKAVSALAEELPLFSQAPAPEEALPEELYNFLEALSPDELTPREALEKLYALKALYSSE